MPRAHRIQRIVSGGQTGVDRAALDAAMALGIPHGGYCPLGRRAEDGRIPINYRLTECGSHRYADRTELNVESADATLILCCGPPTGGTQLTARLAHRHGKPLLLIDLDAPLEVGVVTDWLAAQRVSSLDIAGPRESQCPGIQQRAQQYLVELLR